MIEKNHSLDVEKIEDFLNDFEAGLRCLEERVQNAGKHRDAAQAQFLFATYMLEDIDAKIADIRWVQLVQDNSNEPLWESLGDFLDKFYRLTEIYQIATNCSDYLLEAWADSWAPSEPKSESYTEAKKVIEQCKLHALHLQENWLNLSQQLTEKDGLCERRKIEKMLVEGITSFYDWKSSSHFQSFAFIILGRLLTKDRVEQYRSEVFCGKRPFDFISKATLKHFQCEPKDLFKN